MKAIWKFELNWANKPVAIPNGAKILSAGAQGQSCVIWAIVDPNATVEYRTFCLYFTGTVPDDIVDQIHISTFQASNVLVIHVFEKI